MTIDSDLNRLRWQCRRGMLELDLLLLEFLENEYPALDTASQQAFVALLEYPDQVLQHWLFSPDADDTVDLRVKQIVNRIRSAGQADEQ